MKLNYVLLFFFSTIVAFGQSKIDKEKIIDLFAKSKKAYENEGVFKLNVSYKFFHNYKTGIPSQKYDGVVFKSNTDYYSKINKTEFLKVKNDYLKIDNESRLVEVKKIAPSQDIGEIYNLSGFLTNFTNFKMTSEGNFWVCTMTAPAITFVPYAKVILFIDKTKYTISKQILYFLTKNEYKDSQGKKLSDYPRMEIIFTNFETKGVELGSKFRLNTYIEKNGKKIILSKKYMDKGYKIVD